MSSDDIDWSGVDLEVARHVLSQGEKYLAAQMQSAIAADQRAVTLSSVGATVAGIIITASIAYWDKAKTLDVLVAGLVTGGALLLGAACALWAAKPISFYFPGNHPAQYFGVLSSPLVTLIGGEAENYQEHIAENDKILGENQSALAIGVLITVLAPVAGFLTWMFVP